MAGQSEALQRLRRAHTQAVLDELLRVGATSRGDLARRTGLSRTTLTAIVTDLLARGALVEQSKSGTPRGRGRPVSLLSLNPSAGLVLGVDIAQTWTHIAVVNLAHEVIAAERVATADDANLSSRIRQAVRLIDRTASEYDIELETLEAIGLGMFGIVEDPMLPPGTGVLTKSARQVVNHLSKHYGVDVIADNTARLAALAECTWGAAAGADDAVYLRWSYGVGGGIVIDGKLVRGAHGLAAQLGHVSVERDGPECWSCGGRGCLFQRIRIPVLLENAAAKGTEVATIEDLVSLAEKGDRAVRQVLDEAARDVGYALSAVAVHVDPARIVIGGELTELGELVLERIRTTVREHALPTSSRRLQVTAAALGPEASALGAVALVLRDTLGIRRTELGRTRIGPHVY